MDYKKKMGADFQLLIEPKPREPTKHQYDYDAQTVMGFLHEYGISDHFKINVEPNHTTLAGHESSTTLSCPRRTTRWVPSMQLRDTLLMIPINLLRCTKDCTSCIPCFVRVVWHRGGLNFDAKVQRVHKFGRFLYCTIGGMDAYARGLREDDVLEQMVQDRYSSFDYDLGVILNPDTAILAL